MPYENLGIKIDLIADSQKPLTGFLREKLAKNTKICIVIPL